MRLFPRADLPVSIPEPCHENWEEMDGTARERFCEKCQHSVHDLSKLTRREAARLIESSREKRLCGRITRDVEGRMVFRPDAADGRWPRIAGLSLFGIAGAAMAQEPSGSCQLKVTVVDPTEARIPGASVAVEGLADHANDSGEFTATIRDASAKVQVGASGFESKTLTLVCENGADIEATVILPVQAVTDGVTVSASAESYQVSGGVIAMIHRPTLKDRLRRLWRLVI